MDPNLRIEVLTQDRPIQGQKWFCLSLISPESRQKSQVHALKVRYVCEDEEEARMMCKKLRDNDPDFDVYVAPVGTWLPVYFNVDDIPEQQYTEQQLTELIAGHKAEKEKANTEFEDRMRREREENRKANTPEGIAARLAQPEPPESVYFKILQLREVMKARQDELDFLENKFSSELYSDGDRERAEHHEYAEILVAPSTFQ
jgi:hypothetical protein